MYVPKYRLEAIETIGRKILQEYDRALLEGPPQAIPIETIIETKFNLILEYHSLRKNGSVLGETIFDDGAAILYDQAEKRYRLIAVKAGTILPALPAAVLSLADIAFPIGPSLRHYSPLLCRRASQARCSSSSSKE